MFTGGGRDCVGFQMGGGGGRREDIFFFLSVSRSIVGPDDPSPEEKS